MMKEKRCKDCIHWVQMGYDGECHRYAPKELCKRRQNVALFPMMAPYSYCGEFKQTGEEK